jgi:hypothetical protein
LKANFASRFYEKGFNRSKNNDRFQPLVCTTQHRDMQST